MTMIWSERDVRIQKIEILKQLGINPYAEKFDKKYLIVDLLKNPTNGFRDINDIIVSPVVNFSTAGRIVLYRTHGKLSFAKLQDETSTIQLMFHRDHCFLRKEDGSLVEQLGSGEDVLSPYKLIEKYVDIGDFIGVAGELFLTHKGEITLFVSEFSFLTKAILPLGDKFHGVEDIDMRLRKRYLDTIFHDDVKWMLKRRSKFWKAMRDFLNVRNFMEVETPILEVTTGGADANPFATHHDALDMDVYLRISCGELRQKRLMVAGFEKTFEIGRVFRNEGMSPEHAQDYTQMECYWAYANYQDMMTMIKELYLSIIDTVYGKRIFQIRGYEVDFNQEWRMIDYTQEILDKTGINIFQATEAEMEAKLKELHVKYEPMNRLRLIDTLWKYCRKQISGPAFLINQPTAISPLAKSKIENPELVNKFQIIIAGSEVGNGFSELNDPLDQRKRFQEQQDLRDGGDVEAQMADWEYVEALEHGMPPTAGFGVSERLFCFLEDKPIREAQYFPLMKPLS